MAIFDDETFSPYEKGEHKALKAFELYENGKIPQALSELDAALETNPSNSAWHFNKGLALDSMNKFEDAINEYEIALQLNPDDLEILNSLAVDHTRCGQYDLAINVFEHIEKLDSTFEPSYCNRIITYTEMSLHDMAEQMFYLAQQINADCPLCYYNIGNNLFIRGQYSQAIRCWLRTAELEPAHPQINYRIAQAYWAKGDRQHAREYFLAELRLDPGGIDCLFDFGLFLLEGNDIESAKEKFNRILEFEPDFATALFYLGEIAFNSKNYERAVNLFNSAIQKDDALPGPRYRLAQYVLTQGQKEAAKAYLVSEMALVSEDANVLVSMGSMFLAIGDVDLSTHCLLRAVNINSSNADAYYYLGLVSTIKNEYVEAIEFFGHVLDLRPKDIAASKELASIYLATGRTAEADKLLKETLKLDKKDSQLKALARIIRIKMLKEQIADLFWFLRPSLISNLTNQFRHLFRK